MLDPICALNKRLYRKQVTKDSSFLSSASFFLSGWPKEMGFAWLTLGNETFQRGYEAVRSDHQEERERGRRGKKLNHSFSICSLFFPYSLNGDGRHPTEARIRKCFDTFALLIPALLDFEWNHSYCKKKKGMKWMNREPLFLSRFLCWFSLARSLLWSVLLLEVLLFYFCWSISSGPSVDQFQRLQMQSTTWSERSRESEEIVFVHFVMGLPGRRQTLSMKLIITCCCCCCCWFGSRRMGDGKMRLTASSSSSSSFLFATFCLSSGFWLLMSRGQDKKSRFHNSRVELKQLKKKVDGYSTDQK